MTRNIVLQKLGEFKGGLKLVALSLFEQFRLVCTKTLDNIFIVSKKKKFNLALRVCEIDTAL